MLNAAFPRELRHQKGDTTASAALEGRFVKAKTRHCIVLLEHRNCTHRQANEKKETRKRTKLVSKYDSASVFIIRRPPFSLRRIFTRSRLQAMRMSSDGGQHKPSSSFQRAPRGHRQRLKRFKKNVGRANIHFELVRRCATV